MEYIILWILALFGLWNIISRVVESLFIDNSRGDIEVIIKAKNQEHTIEYLVKELVKISVVGKITVLDMESNDKTLDIVHRLERKNSMVRVVQK